MKANNKSDLVGGNSPKSAEVMATVVFQDADYTIYRNKDNLTNEDMLNVPLHMMLLSLGMLDARTYVPKVGRNNFLGTMKMLQTKFKKHVKTQFALASTIDEPKVEKK